MNIITTIQTALTALNSTAELFLLEKSRSENKELEHTTDTIVVYPDWKTANKFSASLESLKTRVYNIDFKTLDEWDNSDDNETTSYDSNTSVNRIEDMEILADSVFYYISNNNDLFPEIQQKLIWRSNGVILRANNGTMSGVSIQLTVVFSGDRVCDYITTPIPIIPFPNPDDLNTWHKTITGVDFAESINSLPAKFLPRVASFKGTDDTVNFGTTSDLRDTNFRIKISFKAFDITSFQPFVNNYLHNTRGWEIYVASGSIFFRYSWSGSFEIKVLQAVLVIDTLYELDLTKVGRSVTGTVNGNIINLTLSDDMVEPSNSFFIGARPPSYFNGLIFNVEYYDTNGVLKLNSILTGQGNYEYNLVTGGTHGTWAGTGTRFDYDLNGLTYANDNGYSLWRLAGSPDIQVPFDINGLPLSLTPGVDIPAGYTHSYDLLPGGDKHNIYDSLINFNPDGLLDAELDIFDRSNTTIQTAESRASIYFDGTDRTTSSIYHISEIIDPRTYDTFFNPNYKNIIFGRIVLDGINIIRYDEQLNYKTPRAGDTLSENIIYCRFITNIYP